MHSSFPSSRPADAPPRRRQRRAALAPSIERSLEWVLREPVRDADGVLRSWSGGARPSFRYPEATGFLIGVLLDLYRRTGASELLHEARRSATALVGEAHESGGFGRDLTLYAFDSGVCLAAWLRLLAIDGHDAHPLVAEGAARTARFLAGALASGHAAVAAADGTPLAPRRWSLSFGPHQLKAVNALVGAERLGLVSPGTIAAVEAWARGTCASHFHDDHFHWRADRCASYAHAHAYAIEGLLACRRDGVPVKGGAALCRAGGEWLARVQAPGGAIPSWHGEGDELPLLAADATAQAVRIWAVTDRERYGEPIERALRFLDTLTEAGGGVRYAATHDERSSWATLFAIQAVALARLGPSDDPIA